MGPRRFCTLFLAFISLVGAFDLACTLSAHRAGWLEETNPVAKWMLNSCGEAGLASFKVGFTATACLALRAAALAGWRRRPMTVLVGGIALFAICAAVVFQWLRCFAELC
jgi:hypothetical protein